MTPDALLTMVVILGFVWGGFTVLMVKAARSGRRPPAA